jgi:hypothetical protein
VKKKILGIVLVLAASMAVAAVVPVFAENLHVPEGVKLFYFTGGHSGDIDLPSGYPLSQAPWYADKMRIYALYIEGGNSFTGAEIIVWFHLGGSFNTWSPWADFITSDNLDDVVWLRQFWWMLPPSDPVNTKSLLNDDLAVERHGNSITASLKTPQQMVARIPFTTEFPLPAFDMELYKVDGSVHREQVLKNTGMGPLPGSQWTWYREEIGFNGNGAFTCSDWGYDVEPMTDCFIVMHGNATYVPPP